MRHAIYLLAAFFLNPAYATPQEAQTLIQLLDYIAVDYPGAVKQGQVVDAAEYEEMREFSTVVAGKSAVLKTPGLQDQAAQLKALVESKGEVTRLRELAATMRTALIADFGILTQPKQAPEWALGQKLFAENCSSCHGAQGRGDGPLARTLDPSPTDFHDAARAQQRDLYSRYSTITLGVAGTAMAAFPQLSEHQRWSLAAYVGSFSPALDDPAQPRADVAPAITPIENARTLLNQAAQVYANGDAGGAYALALAAYLDGFELAEGALSAVDPALKTKIEEQMLALRSAMKSGAMNEKVQAHALAVDALLALAAQRMGSRKLSGGSAAVSAFIILVREGLEAILVVAALAAFLVRTGQRAALPYLHAGWVAALVLGGITWWVSEHFFEIGGLQRELTEGLAALVAAAVMFSVGFWMHNRSQAAQWQKFIQTRINVALSSGTLWGLAGLSFIAVYRECFETVLFYQALWVQTDAGAQGAVIGGLAAATAVLLALAWGIMKYSLRLPLREFFSASGVLLFVLAVIFAGKGIVATQAAGLIPVSPLPAPRIELLGIYPNAQSLAVQAALVLLAAFMMWRGRAQAPAKA